MNEEEKFLLTNSFKKKKPYAPTSDGGPFSREWTQDDDEILIEAVKKHGQKSWMEIANYFCQRTPSQCRYRFHKIKPKRR